MTDHTPEPWSCEQPWSGFSALRGPSQELIFGIACGGPDEKQPDDVCDANAARIVACVNACAGIPTDQLEAGSVGDMKTTLRDAAKWFREYEDGHAAKGSIDGDAKARRNAERAEHCEAALAAFQKD